MVPRWLGGLPFLLQLHDRNALALDQCGLTGFDFAFYPFLRFGIGTNQGKFRNIPEQTAPPPGVGSGDVGDFRVEGGLGIGARAQLGSRVRIGGSVGVQWWDALETGLVTVRDGVGTVVIDRDDTSFAGRDVFLRLGVEIAY